MMIWKQLVAVIAIGITLSSCATPGGTRIDNIPMYGQPEIVRPDWLKKADQDFIKEAITGFNGSREVASRAWSKVADDFFREGNLDYAMRRYNQAWLLDDKSYLPYWGFGQVMMVQGKTEDAIRFYEKANSIIDDNYQKPALLNDLGLAYSYKARNSSDQNIRDQYFSLANKQFTASAAMDETYAKVWEGWASSLYHEKRYAEAWQKVKKAREKGGTVHPKFLERLSKAMPEPN